MLALRHNGSRHCLHSQLVARGTQGDVDIEPHKNYCTEAAVEGDSNTISHYTISHQR